MADVRPFRGIHYNKSRVKDWSAVICPPHDIINPQLQEELYKASQYNFIRLEFGRDKPDTETDDRYTRAAATLGQWLGEGVLETDPSPAYYLHDHHLTYLRKKYVRRNLIARVRLEEWEKMVIRPHEATMSAPRTDRLSLLRSLKANTSPILAMYEDTQRQISDVTAGQEKVKPLIKSKQVAGESHDLRVITDPDAVHSISMSLSQKPLYVADGHHRYESALKYSREMIAGGQAHADSACNFVMMEMVDFADPGLLILAPHRLVRGITQSKLDGLATGLNRFFEIKKLPLAADVRRQVTDFFQGEDDPGLLLFGPAADCFLNLKLRDRDAAVHMMPFSHSEPYKKLDVSVVNHVILENLLGLDGKSDKTGLDYSHDIADTISRVASHEFQLAILLKPVKPQELKTVSDAGDRMPPKSTYFYPKAPSGLVMNRLV